MHTTKTLSIRLLDNKLRYEPESWTGNRLGTGCYAYAANFECDKFIRIGELIGKPCGVNTSNFQLLATLKEELLSIGYRSIKKVDTNYRVKPGEQKIYLLRDATLGTYHLYRQDDDGGWSNKYPGQKPTRLDPNGQIVFDPDDMCDEDYYGWCFLLERD